MDCKDLMVGDWVSYKYDPPYIVHGISICKVVTIDNGIVHRNVMDDAINQIPLTEEILAKNGFEKRIYTSPSNNEDYLYYRWNPTPEYPDECVWLWPDGDSYTYNSRISDIKINSVHQLQHLLRLAGVQKEIEL